MPITAGRVDTLDAVLQERRSVRGFLPRPVPKDTLERVFTMAQLAPSNCNVQPWGRACRLRRCRRADARFAIRRPRWKGLPEARIFRSPELIPATTAPARSRRPRRCFPPPGWRATMVRRGCSRSNGIFDFSMRRMPLSFSRRPGPACARRRIAACMRNALMLALTALGLASCAQGALSHHAGVVRARIRGGCGYGAAVRPGVRL